MSEKSLLHNVTAQAGASFVDDAGWLVPGSFGNQEIEYREARNGAVVFDVSHRGKVVAAGADAVTFLQNLSTGDVAGTRPGSGCEAFFTNLHAKVIAHALVYRSSQDGAEMLWLETVPGLGGKLVKHLDHYLISEQVELADRTRDLAQLHVAGPKALAVLREALKGLGQGIPDLQPLQHVATVNLQVRRNDALGMPGYDLVGPGERAVGLWEELTKQGTVPAGRDVYEMLRIEAGVPTYGKDIDETNIALEVGRKEAICYTKGCYLGQEPLVRIRDLGHINRLLLGLRMGEARVLLRGAKIFREGTEVGWVTSSAISPRLERGIALAYLRRGSQEPGTAVEVEAEGGRCPAEVSSLPFSA